MTGDGRMSVLAAGTARRLSIIILRAAIGRLGAISGEYRPISFYGYVATHYAATEFRRFEQEVAQFDTADFSREALAEHFMVSRIVKNKTAWVTISGALTFASMALAAYLVSSEERLSIRKSLLGSSTMNGL